ncbi:MAG: hypothetical protein ABIZ70_04435 [Gemmatimonadales bacterium]
MTLIPLRQSRTIRRIFSAATASVAVLLLTGCPGATDIKKLLDDPSHYEGKSVRIAGEVTKAVGALGYGVYEVKDGTGSLTVVNQSGGGTPRVGATVGVEGTFRSAFTVGTRTIAVLLEKQHKTR